MCDYLKQPQKENMSDIDPAAQALSERIGQLANHYASKAEFARVCGLSRQVVYMITGQDIQNISFTVLRKIIRGTGCDANWLMLGAGDPYQTIVSTPSSVKFSTEVIERTVGKLKDGSLSRKDNRDVLKAIHDITGLYLKEAVNNND